MIFSKNAVEYGYIIDENLLLNPLNSNRNYILLVKNKKCYLLNEKTGTLDVPFVYDQILQRFETAKHTYFSIKERGKFGLINEKNEVVIPVIYDAIQLDLIKTN